MVVDPLKDEWATRDVSWQMLGTGNGVVGASGRGGRYTSMFSLTSAMERCSDVSSNTSIRRRRFFPYRISAGEAPRPEWSVERSLSSTKGRASIQSHPWQAAVRDVLREQWLYCMRAVTQC